MASTEGWTMRWFGPTWHSPINDDCPETTIPEPAERCIYCDEGFAPADSGVRLASGEPLHIECLIRMTVGSAAHVNGTCFCAGGSDHDPFDLTRREAALLSFAAYRAKEAGLPI